MNPTDDELEQHLRMLQPAEASPTMKQGIRRQLARARLWRQMGWTAAIVFITAVVLPVVWPIGQANALAQALEAAQEAANLLVKAGVKGVLNFAPTGIKLQPEIFLEHINITLSIEKVVYFARQRKTTKELKK